MYLTSANLATSTPPPPLLLPPLPPPLFLYTSLPLSSASSFPPSPLPLLPLNFPSAFSLYSSSFSPPFLLPPPVHPSPCLLLPFLEEEGRTFSRSFSTFTLIVSRSRLSEPHVSVQRAGNFGRLRLTRARRGYAPGMEISSMHLS